MSNLTHTENPTMHTDHTPSLSWTIPVPLLNSPVVVRQTAGVLVVTFFLVSLLVSVIFALDGDWAAIPHVIGIIGLITLGLGVLALLAMLLLYGNRMHMQFHLDKRGAHSIIIDQRAAKTSRLAVLLGLATGNFTAAGAGMLTHSRSRDSVSWKSIRRFRFDERRQTIYLMGRFHTKAALFCPPEIYPQARSLVEQLCSPE